MFPLHVFALSVLYRMRDIHLKRNNHTYCMSATGPPCIKLSCFSMIAVIIPFKIRWLWASTLASNGALEAADGLNTDSEVLRAFRRATFTPREAIERPRPKITQPQLEGAEAFSEAPEINVWMEGFLKYIRLWQHVEGAKWVDAWMLLLTFKEISFQRASSQRWPAESDIHSET